MSWDASHIEGDGRFVCRSEEKIESEMVDFSERDDSVEKGNESEGVSVSSSPNSLKCAVDDELESSSIGTLYTMLHIAVSWIARGAREHSLEKD